MSLKNKSKRSSRRQAGRASPQDHAPVPYLKARDRFLEAADTTDDIEWLVAVGRFVQDRWLAEEASRKDGEELDEQSCWSLWDQCTEKQLRDLRSEAGIGLKKYVRANATLAVSDWWDRTFKPVHGMALAANWLFWQFLRGIVSGVALIILGIVLTALAPEVVKKARGAADAVLPAATQPDN